MSKLFVISHQIQWIRHANFEIFMNLFQVVEVGLAPSPMDLHAFAQVQ